MLLEVSRQAIHNWICRHSSNSDSIASVDHGLDLYSLSHDQLKRCCQNYLNVDISNYVLPGETLPKASSDSAKDLRQVLATKFPFLEYACRYMLYHADEAALGISQDDFLRDFRLDTWVNISNLFERFG